MPGYRGHLVGGSIAFGFLLVLLQSMQPPVTVMAEWLLCALAGSLFPDIDVKSKGQNYFYKLIILILFIVFLKGHMQLFMVLSSVALIPMIVRHRGLFHRLWFVIGFPLAVVFIVSAYYPQFTNMLLFDVAFFIVGAISHLWLDLGLRKMVTMR